MINLTKTKQVFSREIYTSGCFIPHILFIAVKYTMINDDNLIRASDNMQISSIVTNILFYLATVLKVCHIILF